MWASFTPRAAQKRQAAPVCEQPLPKRIRCCTKFSIAEQAMVTAGLPASVTDIVNSLAMPAHFAAFAKKYGLAAPATYLGEIFVSGWHPRIACDKRNRFGWECDDLRYFVGKELTFKYRPYRPQGVTWSTYVKTLVSVFRDRIVVKEGTEEFSLRRDRLDSAIAFVDIPRPGSGV